PYDVPAYPSHAMRLLALFRFWNMVQYYAPNRDITDARWSDVLASFIPRFISAPDANGYHLAVCELTSALNDTHAATSSPTLTAYWGGYTAPLRTRLVESQTVVTSVFPRLSAADVRVGDVLTDVNGADMPSRRDVLRRYMPSSNEGSRQRNVDAFVLRT